MNFSRIASFVALMLPAVLGAQETAPAPTAAQLKARAEAAKQRAAQQPVAKTPAPATTTTAPQTKAVTPPQTKTATAPQTKAAMPTPAPATLTKSTTPTANTQSKTAATTPTTQSKTATPAAAPQTKATTPPAAPQSKAAAPAPAGGAQTKAAAPAPQTKAPPMVTQQPVPPRRDEVSFQREVFQYAQSNRRDPFVSMITSSDLRPQIGDLKLVTVITTQGGGGSVAILRDLQTKEQYRVRVGQTLGRMRVAQIQPRAVVFAIEEFGYNRQEVLAMNDSTRARTP